MPPRLQVRSSRVVHRRRHLKNAPHRNPAQTLIIEDDPEYSKLLVSAVRDVGYNSLQASSLNAAKRRLKQFSPDLILLDEQLPDGSGIDLCRSIRGEHQTAKALIIVITGNKYVWQHAAWLEAGADQCWPKTRSILRLVSQIKGLVRRRQWDVMEFKPAIPELFVDLREKVLIYADELSAPLSHRELAFIDLLCNAYPDTLTRAEIRERIFSYSRSEQFDLALNKFVDRLKKKLPAKFSDGIHAMYRQGYFLKIPS